MRSGAAAKAPTWLTNHLRGHLPGAGNGPRPGGSSARGQGAGSGPWGNGDQRAQGWLGRTEWGRVAQAGPSQSLVQELLLRERGEPGGSSAGEGTPPRILLFLGELQCCHHFSKSSLLSVPVPEWPAKRRCSGPSPHAMEVALISEPCVSSAHCTSSPCTPDVSPVCMPSWRVCCTWWREGFQGWLQPRQEEAPHGSDAVSPTTLGEASGCPQEQPSAIPGALAVRVKEDVINHVFNAEY